MSDPDLREIMAALRREWADRPFGDVEAVSGATLQPYSRALHYGASNLLDKALRWWEEDRARALRYVDQAVALPYDPHEESYPAALAAHLVLFEAVTDELEAASLGDSRWLDAALAVLRATTNSARFDLRDVLQTVDHDFGLETIERRRLRAAVAGIPPMPETRDLVDLTTAELRERVVDLLDACVAYERACRERDA